MLRYYFLRRHKHNSDSEQDWYELMVSEREFPLGIPVERTICILHSEATGRILADRLNSERRKGVIEGITRFAWWKDGEQFVGTCGTKLTDAIRDVLEERV